MAEQISIDFNINAEESLKVLTEINIQMADLQKQKDELDKAMKDGTATREMVAQYTEIETAMKTLSKARKAEEKEIYNEAQQYRYAEDTLQGMKDRLRQVTDAYNKMSKAQRESDEGKKKAKEIRDLTNNINAMNLAIKPTIFDKFTLGIKSVGMALKTNPIGAIITAIVFVFQKLKSAIQGNKQAMEQIQAATKKLEPIFKFLEGVLMGIVNILVKIIDFYGRLMQGIMDSKFGQWLQEITGIQVRTAEENKKIAEAEKKTLQIKEENAREIKKLDDIINDSAHKSVQERAAAVKKKQELITAEYNAELALLKIKRATAKSNEESSALSKQIEALSNAYSESMRAIRNQSDALTKEIDDNKKARQDANKDFITNQKELDKTLEDMATKAIEDTRKREKEALKIAYNRQVEEYKIRYKGQKRLDEALLELKKQYDKDVQSIDDKYKDENIKNTQTYIKQYWQNILKLGGDQAKEAQKTLNDLEFKAVLAPLEARLELLNSLFDDTSHNRTAEEQAEWNALSNLIASVKELWKKTDEDIEKSENDKLEALRKSNQALQDQLNTQRKLNTLPSDNSRLKYLKQQASDRVKIAQDEYDTISNLDEEFKKKQYKNDEEYTAAKLKADQKLYDSQKELADLEMEVKLSQIALTQEYLNNLSQMTNAFGDLFSVLAEDNEEIQKYANALAWVNIMMDLAQGIAAAVSRGMELGWPAAAVMIPTGIALVTSTIASAISLYKQNNKVASSPKFATGGLVGNQITTRTDDTVDAKLSVGEYVIQSKVVKALGLDFFNRLNGGSGDSTNHFATGGVVPSLSTMRSIDSMIDYDRLRSLMIDAVENIHPVVSVKEVTNMQNKVRVKENVASY